MRTFSKPSPRRQLPPLVCPPKVVGQPTGGRGAAGAWFWLGVALALVGWPAPGVAEEPAAEIESPLAQAARWKLERARLRGGETWEGLIQAESPAEIEFVQIVRPMGQPMRAVVRFLTPAALESLERLPPAEHEQLRARFAAFRHRTWVDAREAEAVTLTRAEEHGVAHFAHRGPWFTLQGFAEEEDTRRAVVRLEQLFRAYRQVLPPRAAPRDLRVRLYGDLDDYRGFVRRIGLDLENVAFYSPRENLLAAGSEISLQTRLLAQVRARHAAEQTRLEGFRDELASRLARVSEELKLRGYSRDEIRQETALRRAAWQEEFARHTRALREVELRNQAKYDEAWRRLFERLAHEAFHAYWENFLYPDTLATAPAWLQEGLAQVFAAGRLEAGMLRVDAPPAGALAELQADLKSDPLPLRELLEAAPARFTDAQRPQQAARLYLYAWGVTHHVLFDANVLATPRWEAYLQRAEQRSSAAQRFEALVDAPLVDFEARWRARVAEWKPPR